MLKIKKILLLALLVFPSICFSADQYKINPYTSKLDNAGPIGLSGSNGNIGINSVNPSCQLDVGSGNICISGTPIAGGSGYLTVADEGSNLTQRTTLNFTGAGVSCVDNAGNTRTDCTIAGGAGSSQWITTAGVGIGTWDNVGIGTIIPTAKLDISGTVRATVLQTVSASAGSIDIGEASANGTNKITISAPSSIASDRTCTLEDDTTPFDSCISSSSSGYWVSSGVGINTTNNVGIGTSNPILQLDLIGQQRIYSASSPALQIYNTTLNNHPLYMYNNNGYITARVANAADAGQLILRNVTTDTVYLSASGLSYLNAGNVGIGTFVPNALFDISSTASQDLFRVNDNGTGDPSPFLINSVGNVGIGTTVLDKIFIIDDRIGASVSNRFAFDAAVGGVSNRTISIYPESNGSSAGAGWVFETTFTNTGGVATVSKMAINPQGGNVGMGTFYPQALLEVVNINAGHSFLVDDSTADTTPFMIDSTGNVGIGTMIADSKFIIDGAGSGIGDRFVLKGFSGGNRTITFERDGGLQSAGIGIRSSINNSEGGAALYLQQPSTVASVGNLGIGTNGPLTSLVHIQNTAAQDLFRIDDNGSLDTSPFVVKSDGNVGVGTETTVSLVHVRKTAGSAVITLDNSGNGNASGIDFYRERTSGQGIIGGSVFMNSDTSTNNAALYIQSQSASANSGNTAPLTPGNGARLILTVGNVTAEGNVGIGTEAVTPTAQLHVVQKSAANAFRVDDVASDTTPFIINSVGNVGIGTSISPNTLYVAGTAEVQGLKIPGNGVVDNYVWTANGTDGTGGWEVATGGSGTNYWNLEAGNVGINTTTVNVGIGTVTTSAELHVVQTASANSFIVGDEVSDTSPFIIDSVGNVGIGTTIVANNKLTIINGNVGIGTWVTAANFNLRGSSRLEGNLTVWPAIGGSNGQVNVDSYTNSIVVGGIVNFRKSSSTTFGVAATTVDNDVLGSFDAKGTDTTPIFGITAGSVEFSQDGTAGSVSVPGRINFKTTPSGSSAPITRLSVRQDGNVGIGTINPVALVNINSNNSYNLFRVDDSAGNDTTPFVINSVGNVGIGTVTVPNALYVVGTGVFTTGLNIGIGTASPTRLCIANNQISTCP